MTFDAPVMSPTATPPGRHVSAPFIFAGIVLGVVYAAGGTWSIGQGFGGYGADGGWIDFQGRPTTSAPPQVDAVGHPSLWVFLVLTGLLLLTAIWANRGAPQLWRRRAIVGCAVATVFVIAVVLLFTVLQMKLIGDAFADGDTHPPILGNVTVTTSRMPPG